MFSVFIVVVVVVVVSIAAVILAPDSSQVSRPSLNVEPYVDAPLKHPLSRDYKSMSAENTTVHLCITSKIAASGAHSKMRIN